MGLYIGLPSTECRSVFDLLSALYLNQVSWKNCKGLPGIVFF